MQQAQQQSTRTQMQKAHSNWENKFANTLYQNQNKWWAKGLMGIAAGLNSDAMHMALHGATPRRAMDPTVAIREAYSGHDPLTGRPVSLTQAYVDAGISAVTFVAGGELDSVASKLAFGVDNVIADVSSVGRNWASMFGDTQVNALSPMRLRVMQDIADSQASHSETGFSVLEAKTNQIASGYSADTWQMTTLNKGDFVYGGLPGQSEYYTDEAALLNSAGDRNALYPSLQVKLNPERGAYRPNIGVYQVMGDIRVPTGTVAANPKFGPGGAAQFFIGSHLTPQLKLLNEFELREFYEKTVPTYRPCH